MFPLPRPTSAGYTPLTRLRCPENEDLGLAFLVRYRQEATVPGSVTKQEADFVRCSGENVTLMDVKHSLVQMQCSVQDVDVLPKAAVKFLEELCRDLC